MVRLLPPAVGVRVLMGRVLMASAGIVVGLWGRELSAQGAKQNAPRLSLSFVTKNPDEGPLNVTASVEVDASGHVAFLSNNSSEERLTVVDAQGHLTLRFGRTGSGPSEVRSPRLISMSAAQPTTWDVALGRLTEWDSKGATRFSLATATSTQVQAVAPGGYLGFRVGSEKPSPVLLDKGTGEVRPLLLASDTFAQANFSAIRTARTVRTGPLLGLWQDGFLLGDATAYRIAMYRWDGTLVRVLGRDLPFAPLSNSRVETMLKPMLKAMRASGKAVNDADLASQRAKMAALEFPRIMPGGTTRPDSKNRVWFLGVDGDEAFADVFSTTSFLGRVHVPCKGFLGSWSISGSWLAVSCESDDPSFEGDAVIKLFRIIEP